MQNCFFLLELPFASPDLDEELILDAIRTKQRQWSRELSHPIKRVFAKECLEQLPAIRAVMLNRDTRIEESYKAINIKASKEDALKVDIDILKETNADITESDIEKLTKKYRQYGFTKEEIKLSIQQGVYSSNCAGTGACMRVESHISKEPPYTLSVGIDFGASFIKVAIAGENGVVEIVQDEDGMIRFPATVVYDNDGYANVGEALENIDVDMLHRTCCFVRNSLLESNVIDGFDVTKEAIGFILKATVGLAEEYWRERHPCHCQPIVFDIIVCYPSWFTALENKIFAEACKDSGVNLVGLLDDSSAIAAAYDIVTGNEGKNFLIFDLGFSTLFIGKILIKEKSVILEHYEHCDIAGKLWTESILYYLLEQLGLSTDNIELDMLNYLKGKAAHAKEELSYSYTTTITVGLHELNKTITLSRSHFETLSEPYMKKAIQIAQHVAGDTPIYQILLAGGESNMPRVRDALEYAFGIEVRKYKPDSAVSIGALLHCKKSISK